MKISILTTQLHLDKIKYSEVSVTTQDMFGGGKKDKQEKQKKAEVMLKLAGFDKTLKHLEHLQKHPNKPLQFFDWKLDFPEILNSAIAEREGFDIVIGNPPWVSMKGKFGIEESKRNNFEVLQQFYTVSTYRPNLFEFFVIKALTLVQKNCVFCFIIPDRLGYNSYLGYLRNSLLSNQRIVEIVYKWKFETVIADTMTLLLRNVEQDNYLIRVKNRPLEDALLIAKHEYLLNPNFIFKSYDKEFTRNLVNKIRSSSRPLLEFATTGTGFIGVSSLISEKRQNKNQIEILKGECISNYRVDYKLYYDFREANIKGGTKDTRKLGKKNKVLVRKTGNRIIAAVDVEGLYPEQSLYFIYDLIAGISPEYLLALLNSKLLTWYYLNQLVTNEDSTPQIKNYDLDNLPIVHRGNQAVIQEIVTQIIATDSRTNALLVRKLDTIAFHLYNLTYTEAKVIDPALSEEEFSRYGA